MTENRYQAHIIRRLYKMLPSNTIVIKTDPSYNQGFPDLLILCGPYWAALEVKANRGARSRPNQPYYIETLNAMSFAAFIYPENEEEVLNALQQAFEPPRRARVS